MVAVVVVVDEKQLYTFILTDTHLFWNESICFDASELRVVCVVRNSAGKKMYAGKLRFYLRSTITMSHKAKAEAEQAAGPSQVGPGHLNEKELANLIGKAKEKLIKDGFHGPSIWPQIIAWGDHDQFQHVNNVHFSKFIESNRMLFFSLISQQMGAERHDDIVKGKGVGIILSSLAIRFKRPVLYPDTILVGRKPILPLTGGRFTIQTTLFSIAQQAEVASAEESGVCYDYKALKKVDLPEDFRQALEDAAKNPAGSIKSRL